ncbi:hypothetical protein C8F01DRAFT_20959 [Mycena amicta]|nr:hypothetical protein C8F01DRAFT_20959 [Mycena amicta]
MPRSRHDAPKPFSFGPSSFASTVVPEPPFGGGFTFEQPVKEPPKSTPAPSTFTFGAPATTTAVDVAAKPSSAPFSFGATSTPASTSTFSFAASDPKPSFSFGTPTMPAAARPVTPPRNEVPEFKMDESPTRELVSAEAKAAESRPSLGGPAFSFGNPASGSIFGASAPAAPSLFSFGSPTAANPNTFSSAASPAENKPFGSTDFGRPSSSSSNPFGFGQNTTNAEPARPATSFSFGAPTSSTGTFNAFGSGTPTTTTAPSNPFGGSAPSSPSTFSQPFSFGASPAAAPFAFGASQPASPAGSVSSLPQPSTPGGFGASPSFASGGGGGLFTIGAAPAPQARQMKKLPRRKN